MSTGLKGTLMVGAILGLLIIAFDILNLVGNMLVVAPKPQEIEEFGVGLYNTSIQLVQVYESRIPILIAIISAGFRNIFSILLAPVFYLSLRRERITYAIFGSILWISGNLFLIGVGSAESVVLRIAETFHNATGAARTSLVISADGFIALSEAFGMVGGILFGFSILILGIGMVKGFYGKRVGWAGISTGIVLFLPPPLWTFLGAVPIEFGPIFIYPVGTLVVVMKSIWLLGVSRKLLRPPLVM